MNDASGTPEQPAAWVAYCYANPGNDGVLEIGSMGRNWKTIAHWAARQR